MATTKLLAMQQPLAARDDWETPARIFAPLHAEFGFTLDACATPATAKVPVYYTPDDDGLQQPWTGVVFVNPPFGPVISQWVARAVESWRQGATVVMLVPARTDTRWWHAYIEPYAEVRFVKGRIRFVGAKHNAPFPSAVVIFRAAEGRTGL